MKKLLTFLLLGVVTVLGYTAVMRRRAEQNLPVEGLSGEVPLTPSGTFGDMP